jgi:hypothetical protein
LLALRRSGRAVPGQSSETARLDLQPLDFLVEIKRTECRCRAHRGIDQHENRDDRAVLIFLHEIQTEIDQRQKSKIGGEAIGVAQKFHWLVPIDNQPGSMYRTRIAGLPLGRPELPASVL